jgi:hypothetical protein
VAEFDHAWRVAIHEAAHAVADLVTDVEVVEVWSDGVTGWCRSRAPTNAVSCMAGFASEWHIDRPGRIPAPDDFERNWDKEDVRRAAAYLGTSDGNALRAVWHEARAVVVLHWDAIIAIAEALHARGSLSGAEVEALWQGQPLAA